MINLSQYRKTLQPIVKVGLFFLLASGLAGCNLSNSTSTSNGGNQMTVLLYDAPAIYNSVTLNVLKVETKTSTDNSWTTLNSQPFSVNLLGLSNGNYVVIGQANGLKSGTYNQIRLELGTGDQIAVSGKTYNLAVDTTFGSNLDLSINSNVDSQTNSVVMLDFDVARSVSMSKDSTFTLKPFVRANELSNTGAIQGQVSQALTMPVIYAINAGDTVTSTYANSTGNFAFLGLPVGTYNLAIQPRAGSYKDTTLSNVQVQAANTLQLNQISLSN